MTSRFGSLPHGISPLTSSHTFAGFLSSSPSSPQLDSHPLSRSSPIPSTSSETVFTNSNPPITWSSLASSASQSTSKPTATTFTNDRNPPNKAEYQHVHRSSSSSPSSAASSSSPTISIASTQTPKEKEAIVYSFGLTSSGQCGIGPRSTTTTTNNGISSNSTIAKRSRQRTDDEVCLTPLPVKSLGHRRPIQVCAAQDYSLIVTGTSSNFSSKYCGTNAITIRRRWRSVHIRKWRIRQGKSNLLELRVFVSILKLKHTNHLCYSSATETNHSRANHGTRRSQRSSLISDLNKSFKPTLASSIPSL
jgi:hypothetical protein